MADRDRAIDLSFERSRALVVGVDAYDPARGVTPLRSAVADADAVARALIRGQGFDAQLLVNVSAEDLRVALRELATQITKADRVVFYFAGHGLWREDDGGPGGYLLLRDALARDPTTFLAMRELHEALVALPCRHVLIVLDCCFAGAFRWTSSRDVMLPARVSRQRFQRYVEAAAWQAITSAAPDQLALDGLGERDGAGDSGGHSPFAAALLEGLGGKADANDDGLITATELYLYARGRVEDVTERRHGLQSPGLFPLRKHDRGEFVFRNPGRALRLPAAELLTLDKNPYRGLFSFEEEHRALFFGRTRAVIGLAKVMLRCPLTVVAGASGTGKSSLVKAGLLPAIRNRAASPRPGRPPWHLIGPYRPREAVEAGLLTAARPDGITVVVIDQLEEVLTPPAGREAEAQQLLETLARWIASAPDCVHVIVTVRSDFEPMLEDGPLAAWWRAGRFVVPPLSLDELRAVIERPADLRDLHFEPSRLADQIANEVAQMPGALPLLSFTLSELYRVYCERGDDDRALRESDYRKLGGVASSVTRRADAELAALVAQDPRYHHTVRNVMLRVTDEIGGERARRRVPRSELVYERTDENSRVAAVLDRYVHARLLVVEAVAPDQAAGERSFVEPAHDVMIRGWPQMLRWLDQAAPQRPLVRAVAAAALAWSERRDPRDLWHANPRLEQLEALAHGPDHPLNALELEFASRSSRRRRDRRVRLASIVAAVIGVLAVIATIALVQRSRAIDARDAEARSRDRAEQLVDHMVYDLPDRLQAVGQPDAMRSTADRIAGYYRALRVESSALDPDQRRRMLAGQNALANVWLDQGQQSTASEAFEEALRQGDVLARARPDSTSIQRDLYVTHMGLAAVAAAREQWVHANEEVARARSIIERLLAIRPDDPQWPVDRAQVLLRQAQLAQRSGDSGTRAIAQQAVDALESLVTKTPDRQEVVLGLVDADRLLVTLMDGETEGMARAKLGVRIEALLKQLPRDRFDARVVEGRSRAVIDGVATRGLLSFRQLLSIPDLASKGPLAAQLTALYDASLREARDACDDSHALATIAPRNLPWQRRWFECRLVLAQLRMALGDGQGTEDSVTDAWRVQQQNEKSFPTDPEVRRDGQLAEDVAGVNRRQHGDLDVAAQLFQRSLDRARAHAAAVPGDAVASADVAVSLLNLAQVEVDRGHFDAVVKAADEALALCATSTVVSCTEVRALAEEIPRRAGAIPLVVRLRVDRVAGLERRVAEGAGCFGYVRPPPKRADDGCQRAVISCSGWRLLGTDTAMGAIAIRGSGSSCKSASRLDLAAGKLHLAETNLLGTYTVDASIVR